MTSSSTRRHHGGSLEEYDLKHGGGKLADDSRIVVDLVESADSNKGFRSFTLPGMYIFLGAV